MALSLCFIDFAPWDYNVATPTQRPLGGSQSAMCYLAVELANLGHEVTTVTGTTEPGNVFGVECRSLDSATSAVGIFDAMIILNAPGNGRLMREMMVWPHTATRTRLIIWTQHASNQPVMRKLKPGHFGDAWDNIVCVSDWQRREVIEKLGVDDRKISVIRNAIAPSFENLFTSHADFVAAKDGDVLRLAYTSTPYRGLELLPRIFRPFRAANPDAELEVYSSMAVYMEDAAQDRAEHGYIYDALAGCDGVKLHGSLPQPELAKRLRGAHILTYANAFPETSCIAVMEALAAGMRVITSDLGALPETCEGFASLVPIEIDIDDAATTINIRNADAYTAGFGRALAKNYSTAGLYQQAEHMNKHHTWAVRAKQWAEFLS